MHKKKVTKKRCTKDKRTNQKRNNKGKDIPYIIGVTTRHDYIEEDEPQHLHSQPFYIIIRIAVDFLSVFD